MEYNHHKRRPHIERSATMMIPATADSPLKKKRAVAVRERSPRNVTASWSPDHDSILEDEQINYIRNQMYLLQSITPDHPAYDITFNDVVARLKTRPPFRTVKDDGEDDGTHYTWNVKFTDDIKYRYEMTEIGSEAMLLCKFWQEAPVNRYIDILSLRLVSNLTPILCIHNHGYMATSLIGSEFKHSFYAYEYFVRFLYSLKSIWRRRKLFTPSRHIMLQALPDNPLDLRVQVLVSVASPTFAVETDYVDAGTLQDMLFAKPKPLMIKGGKRKPNALKKD